MLDNEASAFIPYLVLKVSQSIDKTPKSTFQEIYIYHILQKFFERGEGHLQPFTVVQNFVHMFFSLIRVSFFYKGTALMWGCVKYKVFVSLYCIPQRKNDYINTEYFIKLLRTLWTSFIAQ